MRCVRRQSDLLAMAFLRNGKQSDLQAMAFSESSVRKRRSGRMVVFERMGIFFLSCRFPKIGKSSLCVILIQRESLFCDKTQGEDPPDSSRFL
jgi:hypothetical protein